MFINRIAITLGMGADFALIGNNDDDIRTPDRLVLQRCNGVDLIRIDLGVATKKRIQQLQEYLEQLKIHCPDE